MSYDPAIGTWVEKDPGGYIDGLNDYEFVRDDPTSYLDPTGLQTAATRPTTQPWYQQQGCDNDCEAVIKAIFNSIPALPDGRLATARDTSGFDPLVLVAAAYKESNFNPEARNPNSSATGLFQITTPTANDIETRIVPNFISKTNPMVPEGQHLRDLRTDPNIASAAAYVNMLDRIAAAGNNLEGGLDRFGTGPGTGYGKKLLAGVNALKAACGFKQGQVVTYDQLIDCAKKHCKELKAALDKAVH